MNIRLSRRVLGGLVLGAAVLMAGQCLAVFYPLGPSKDEWGLKYNVEMSAAAGDKLNVRFTLADAGRLKPIVSATVVAFSELDSNGGRSYRVKAPIKLETTKDGKRVGQVQIPKQFADIAIIRILTLTVDGRHQSAGAAYYDIPLKKFLEPAAVTASPAESESIASPPAAKAKK